MNNPPLRSLMDFALDAAWQAGRVTLGYFQREIDVQRKGDDTPVTMADQQAEQLIREMIGRYWPDHGILGEEYGEQGGQSRYMWIIDPIDGTKSFVCGVPIYSTLIALVPELGQPPVLGVAHFPALSETVYAYQGGGCYWNGRPAMVSQVDKLEDAVLLCTSFGSFERYNKAEQWAALTQRAAVRRAWGDAYGYALVATGRAEIMADPAMSVWDCGPLQVILEEAGGTFTDWEGTPTIYGQDSIATNGRLYDQVMGLLR